MPQSKAVRDRQNRKDTSERFTEAVTGSMIDVTTYNGNVRMLDVKTPVPSSASFAGKIMDGVLPTED